MKKFFWENLRRFIVFFVVFIASFSLADFVFAQSGSDLTGLSFAESIGLGTADPQIVAARLIQIFIGFLGIIALSLIIYAGYLWMTSAGDAAKIDKAKSILKSAAIGMLIIFASYGIVSFILNALLSASNGSGEEVNGAGGGYGGTIGALGNGIIKSVYPEPGQKEVPRNTSIIVTFRESIDPKTICQTSGNTCNGENIVIENIRIFQASQKDSCQRVGNSVTNCNVSNFTNVKAYTKDNQTFVFSPSGYLGSPTENIWYGVTLSNDIKKADGSFAFSALGSGYEWQFEVSSKLDLTPPQVLSGGVFPAPDNQRDTAGSSTPAVAARGSITINSQPQVYAARSVSAPVPGGSSGAASITGTYNCLDDGHIIVSITGGMTVSVSGVAGLASGASVSGGTAPLGCGITLVPGSGTFTAGNSWSFDVVQEKQADSITIGANNYIFVSAAPAGNQILRGATMGQTAANIVSGLATNPDVSASAVGSVVHLTAKVAGDSGNSLSLSASNASSLTITAMSGGVDKQSNSVINGRKDKPMNSIIQVNFNEAVNPMTVSGKSSDVQNYIRVVNMTAGNSIVAGKFVISNQYKTVEFISDTQCGMNACGEAIYCLPANSQLRVELVAASLFICSGAADCASKSPFTACNGSLCQDTVSSSTPLNFPGANLPANGITDVSFNSLDGNRNGNAEGQVSFYNENSPSAQGDDFEWSFFISDILDLTPPTIASTDAANGGANTDLYAPVSINFDKVMMSSSLATGATTITNGAQTTVHQLINLSTFSNQPIGYWVTNVGIDNAPADGEPESTSAFVGHTDFAASTSYRAQVGSGVKDIYQNCYKPCAGAACFGAQSVTPGSPSCCSGTPKAAASCQ